MFQFLEESGLFSMLAHSNTHGIFQGPLAKLIGIMDHSRILTAYDLQPNIAVPRILPVFGYKQAVYHHGSVIHLEGMFDKEVSKVLFPG